MFHARTYETDISQFIAKEGKEHEVAKITVSIGTLNLGKKNEISKRIFYYSKK
jgi:hypothetical protein